jgi:hypothetical protein
VRDDLEFSDDALIDLTDALPENDTEAPDGYDEDGDEDEGGGTSLWEVLRGYFE